MKKKGTSYTTIEKGEIVAYFSEHGFDATATKFPGVTPQGIRAWVKYNKNPKPAKAHKPVALLSGGVNDGELVIENQRLRKCLGILLGM